MASLIVKQELSKSTAQAWRKFMASSDGQEGLRWLIAKMPVVQQDPEPLKIAHSGGIQIGYLRTFTNIEALCDVEKFATSKDNDEL